MRVLIVGAGIAGLALARVLHGRGITADVVERAFHWQPAGAGLYLPANAVRALGELGLDQAMAGLAHPIRRQRLQDHRGRLLADLDVERIWEMGVPCVAIHRVDLHRSLRRACRGVPVRLGTAVAGVRDGHPPEVIFADGSAGRFDLVVGADGVHSAVRAHAFGGPPARYAGQISWRFVVDDFPAISDLTVMLGRGASFLILALGGGRVYCHANADIADPAVLAGQDWRHLFADFAGPAPWLLAHAEEAHRTPIEEVTPPVWTGERVVLIGDAAHGGSPNTAQGTAMAVEDALILADSLTTRPTLDHALAAYRERRAGRVGWVRRLTHRDDRVRSLPGPVRDLTLRLGAARIVRSACRPLRAHP